MTEQDSPFVRGFDSIEEMLATMRRNEEQANARLSETQKQIRDAVDVRHYLYVVDPRTGIEIFGQVDKLDDVLTRERKHYDTIMDEEQRSEYEAICEGLRDARRRGHLYGTWCSRVEPDGDLGSKHVVTVHPIEHDVFVFARRRGWRLLS